MRLLAVTLLDSSQLSLPVASPLNTGNYKLKGFFSPIDLSVTVVFSTLYSDCKTPREVIQCWKRSGDLSPDLFLIKLAIGNNLEDIRMLPITYWFSHFSNFSTKIKKILRDNAPLTFS